MIVDRGPGRPRRPELRLPGAQGDPARRRLGPAVADQPVRRHSSRAAVRAADGAAAGDGEDAAGRRRRPPDLPRGRRCGPRTPASAYVALHGRTAADFYGGQADWEPIAELAELLDIPVLGNGDIWEAADAVRMVRETGCAGVVVGRGCLGRPWLFADLAAAFRGRAAHRAARPGPRSPRAMYRHAELLGDWLGDERGVVDFRKHVAWYLKGFSVGSELRTALAMASSLAELADLLGQLDLTSRSRSRCSASPAAAPPAPAGWPARRLAGRPGLPRGAVRRRAGRLRRLMAAETPVTPAVRRRARAVA